MAATMVQHDRGSIRRVLFILQTTAVGGMEALCVDQAAELTRRGVEVVAMLPEAPRHDILADRFRAGGARVFRQDIYPPYHAPSEVRARARHLSRLAWRFGRLLVRWRPDVVHLHRGNVVGGLTLLLQARALTGAAVTFTEHNLPFPGMKWRHKLTTRIMDRLAHAIIAVSRYNATHRREALGGPSDRFAAILNGIPIEERPASERAANRATVRARLGIDAGTVVVGCVVRLVDEKGLDDLVRAVAQLRDEPATGRATPRDCALLLVGDGDLRAPLEQLAAELGIADRVIFAGFQADPRPFRDAMDVFALAVPAGTMSIALLEAMAEGIPSVITFCGPEEAIIHDESGLCAPPSDPAGLAAVLARLVDDPALRASLGADGAEHVRRHFSIARCVDDHLLLYGAVRTGPVPTRLRADGPPDPRPGDAAPAPAEAGAGRACAGGGAPTNAP